MLSDFFLIIFNWKISDEKNKHWRGNIFAAIWIWNPTGWSPWYLSKLPLAYSLEDFPACPAKRDLLGRRQVRNLPCLRQTGAHASGLSASHAESACLVFISLRKYQTAPRLLIAFIPVCRPLGSRWEQAGAKADKKIRAGINPPLNKTIFLSI